MSSRISDHTAAARTLHTSFVEHARAGAFGPLLDPRDISVVYQPMDHAMHLRVGKAKRLVWCDQPTFNDVKSAVTQAVRELERMQPGYAQYVADREIEIHPIDWGKVNNG